MLFIRKHPRPPQRIRLLNVSGPKGFDLETVPDLFGFSCDEADGPVTVTFHPDLVGENIELGALRELLDDAEAEILRRREEWHAAGWSNEP